MLQQIEDRLKEHHPPTNEFVQQASLCSLSMHRGEPSLLLTRRSTKLRSFSGHVSFPEAKEIRKTNQIIVLLSGRAGKKLG